MAGCLKSMSKTRVPMFSVFVVAAAEARSVIGSAILVGKWSGYISVEYPSFSISWTCLIQFFPFVKLKGKGYVPNLNGLINTLTVK